jgi:catechol 2,3-dioxygenase-like lactoylglutathione lyase family enzyme
MAITFGRVAPTFYVSDLERAIAFWTEKLGFEVKFTNGEPAVFAAVRRDAAEVHLGVDAKRTGQCHCHFMVEGLEDLAGVLTQNGTTIKQPLKNQPWGLQDMVIIDPDGNTMEIAEPTPK